MPSRKRSKSKALGKYSHQTQGNAYHTMTSPLPHGDHDRLIPPNSRRSSSSTLSEPLLDIMKKMDQSLEFISAMDKKLTALSAHVDRLERLITRLGRSTGQVDSLAWRQQDEIQKCVEHLLQEKHRLAACVEQLERQVPATSLEVLGLPAEEEGKDLGGAFPGGLVSHILRLDTSEEPVVVEKIFWVEMRGRDQALSSAGAWLSM